MTVHLYKQSHKINIRRGVRREDISPKLFTAALESMFRRQLTWEITGLKMNGEYHSHFRFADHILICANTPQELQQMIQ